MPPAKLRFLAVPDFRAKGVAGARVAPMSVAAVQPGIDGKLSNARTLLLLDTAGKEFPSSGVSFREALETCVPPDAHPDPRDMAATENFMIEDEVDDLATAYDAAVVDADLLPLTLPPPSIRSNHDDVKSFLLSALEREDATAGTGLRIADLDLVEAPIVSRASVFDDDSTLVAPTGARLALELEKHFRGDGGWLPTNSPSPPPRSELFAPLNPRDRDRAARASAEREMRAPFDARVRRALAAVDRADFTPPTDDDEQLDPLRELPVPVILQDTHAPTLTSSEPVELLAARMGFKQVSVPRVDLTWPPDAVAAAKAAFDGGELEPVTQPAAPQPSPPAWNLADTTRVMAADDVHVHPPAHVGSVVAALDAAGDAARALLERQERAADAMAEAADIEKAMRSDESFERASRELRVHSRAVLMGSGGGNNSKDGAVEGNADVTFFIRPGGLRPDCARSPADFSAPPPIQSPTAREANRLCKLVESPLCDPQPPRATRAAGDGYGGYGGSHPVIDLTTQRIDRDAGANPIRVPPEISVEVIDDDDAALLDAADHAARTARQIHTNAEFKESDLDYVDDLAYPPVPIPRPRAARRSPPRSAFNPGRDVDEYPRVPGPARNPSPPPLRQAPDDAGWGGWEDWNGLGTRGDEGFNRSRPAPPSPPDRSPLRDFRLDDEFDEPMTDVRRMVSDWRTPVAATSPPRRIDRGWGRNASAVPRERRRRGGSIDSFDFDQTFDHTRRLNSRAPPPPPMDHRGLDDRRFPSRRHRSVSPPGRRYGHDDRDRYDDRYELPAYPRSAARGPASFDPRDFGSGYGIEASGRDREAHDARYRGAGGGDAAWGTPEKLRGMGRRTREHGAGGFMGSRAEGESPFSRGGRGRSRAEGGFGFDDFGFGVASRGLVAGRRERARDKGLDEFMKMTGQFRYGA